MIISPNRKDFWRYPVYRALIPKLMEQPHLSLQYLQQDKAWLIGDRKVVIKGKQLSPIVEIVIRLYREIRFIFNKTYQSYFFSAKDRIERAYEEAIGREKNNRWEVEEKKENFPKREKEAQQQLQRLNQVTQSCHRTLEKINEESDQFKAALQSQLDELKQQKQWWEDFKSGHVGEPQYIASVVGLEQATGVLVHFLSAIDQFHMQERLAAEIAAKELEIREKAQYYRDAILHIESELETAEMRKRKIQMVVQKIPNSPLKQASEQRLSADLEQVKMVIAQ